MIKRSKHNNYRTIFTCIWVCNRSVHYKVFRFYRLAVVFSLCVNLIECWFHSVDPHCVRCGMQRSKISKFEFHVSFTFEIFHLFCFSSLCSLYSVQTYFFTLYGWRRKKASIKREPGGKMPTTIVCWHKKNLQHIRMLMMLKRRS